MSITNAIILVPSGKGMQSIINATYDYGHVHDIVFNTFKSSVMFYDTLRIGEAANIMLGETILTVSQSYRYLGHIVTNDLSDEADE